jgi:hypothetical protein
VRHSAGQNSPVPLCCADGRGQLIGLAEFANSVSTGDARLVCDEALHLVSPAGLAPCPACGRAYCRVCHPAACPKCGHLEQRAGLAHQLAAAQG